MRLESIAMRLRSGYEAADFGVRLYQHSWRDVWRCYAPIYAPLALLCLLASFQVSEWFSLVPWLLKPWLDRTILFVLARALLGERTSLQQFRAAARVVLLAQPLQTLVRLRLSASRSFRQPVIQLEGLSGAALRARMRQLSSGRLALARALTIAYALAELGLTIALFSLLLWFAPPGPAEPLWQQFLAEEPNWINVGYLAAWLLAILLLEPFYVASGFALYLNRRVDLEAWDVEQELRVAFAR